MGCIRPYLVQPLGVLVHVVFVDVPLDALQQAPLQAAGREGAAQGERG